MRTDAATNLAGIITHAATLLAVIAAVTVLAIHGNVNGSDAFTALVGLGGVATGGVTGAVAASSTLKAVTHTIGIAAPAPSSDPPVAVPGPTS